MFKRKKKVEVLSVKHEKRTVTNSTKMSGYSLGYSHEEKEVTPVNYTVVLCVVGGELMTREFNGKWELDDVRKWEEL